MERERIQRLFEYLGSTLVEFIFEEPEVLGTVVLALVGAVVVWCIGVFIYDLLLDPHVITAATLDSMSINPDKWISR
jgi:hypothetical protein